MGTLYPNGQAIDKPIGVVRMNYADNPYGTTGGLLRWTEPFALVPHWNLRGTAQSGTFASDGGRDRCQSYGGQTRCVQIDWPDGWFPYNPVPQLSEYWFGTLLTDKRDGSGLLYRRNRYYDPSSARFTQEDPIGLAGGLNVYGFAAGDPVTYSDPFGLCPPEDHILDDCSDSEIIMLRTNARLAPARPFLNGAAAGVVEGGMAMLGGWAARGLRVIGRTLFRGRGPGQATGRVLGVAGSEAHNAANALRLSKQLASIAQMGERGVIIAGGPSGTTFRNASRYAAQYGGEASDWVKKSSSIFRAADGTAFETHWVEHLRTGARVDFKTNFIR